MLLPHRVDKFVAERFGPCTSGQSAIEVDAKIRIAIADDHPLVINGLVQVLGCCEDMEIISTYSNASDLLQGLKTLQPDILLLDIYMPGMKGDEAAPMILEEFKNIKIITLTNQDDLAYVRSMMRSGVSGYLLKTSEADTIVSAIRSVYNGGTFVDPLVQERVLHDTLQRGREARPVQITRREKEVLELIASNFTSQEIADRLYLSKRTIDNHRMSLLLKLEVKNSAALVKKAMQMGLLTH